MPFIDDFNQNVPVQSATVSGGAAELRAIKDTLNDTFPNFDQAVTAFGRSVVFANDAAALATLLSLGTAAFVNTGVIVGTLPLLQDVGGSPKIPSALLDLPAASVVFASGTRMLFNQTAAPTGWTKETNSTFNDRALRLVTGTVGSGGSSPFSTVFGGTATQGHTLTIDEIPAHTHLADQVDPAPGSVIAGGEPGSISGPATYETGSTGGGNSHSHGLELRVEYRDVIIAQKA